VLLSTANVLHKQLLRPEEVELYGFILDTSAPDSFAKASLAAQGATPGEDSAIIAECHRVAQLTDDLLDLYST
jgi:hypothetical protein